MLPLCFVLMPFGTKSDPQGISIQFDAVFADAIKPSIGDAGMEAIRADEEQAGGIIHKPMFERLVLCEYAVADLSLANANVFYELGVRHAARPHSTVLIFAEGMRLPFDVAPLKALPYKVGADGRPAEPEVLRGQIAERLREARRCVEDGAGCDSPLYQLLEDYPGIQREKTDVFREQVRYAEGMKRRIGEARRQGEEALAALEGELGDDRALAGIESGVLVDLFLSYRAVKAWGRMIALEKRMPRVLASTVLVREQLAFALNRAGRGEEAEEVLLDLIARRGASSETNGLLGRVYKDRWDKAVKKGDAFEAKGLLRKAIEAYLRGFEADWKDAYPGINAVTLMEIADPPDSRRLQILPVVSYAVERRIASVTPDYWDFATRVELAVLGGNEEAGLAALGDALACVRESWEPETTARNLVLIREARERRGQAVPEWTAFAEKKLTEKAAARLPQSEIRP